MVGGEISFGRFRLDLARRELRRDNSAVRLGSRALDILCVLASAEGAVVTKDELMARVWGGVVVEENNLQVHISALRKTLEEDENDGSSIVTVPGRGYRLLRSPDLLAADTSAPAPSVPLPDRPSVAVLPFQNMSGDPEQEYFADGMVEEIITALSRIRWLFVTARNSTFAYKSQNVDVKRVGRELGVGYVLEGSVRKSGNRVRITAQLIDAGTGAHLWADRFDGPLEDVFDLQDKVASSVAGVIEPALQAAETARSKGRPTNDLTAYDLYLRAHAMVWSSAGQIPEALALLEQAIKCDPSYGPALAWAAFCYYRLLLDGRSDAPAIDRLKGVDFARRALEVAGDDPITLTNAAQALAFFGEDIGAMMALVDRALALNPNFARGWHSSAALRLNAGQPDIAIAHVEAALRLSPGARVGTSLTVMGAAHFLARRFDEAVPKLLLAIQQDPSFPVPYRYLAACYAHMGRLAEARGIIGRLHAISTVVIPDASHLRSVEHRELFLSGLRLATGKSRSIDAVERRGDRLLRSPEPPAAGGAVKSEHERGSIKPEMVPSKTELRLLGPLSLAIDGRELRQLPRKADALLALLALQPGRPIAREAVADFLWTDRGPEQARASLRQTLLVVRHSAGGNLILAEGNCLVIPPGTLIVDAIEFEARAASTDRDVLAEAAALYRGELLENCGPVASRFDEWLAIERSRLSALAATILRRLALASASVGEIETAIAAAMRLVAIDNLREDSHRLLIELLARAGRKGEALRRFDAVAALLKRELGVPPSDETVALVDRIRRESSRPAPIGSAERPTPAAAITIAETVPHAVRPPAMPDKPSIAVLPFQNISGDPEHEYFVDGMVEEIITALSRIRWLFVTARNSSFSYKGQSPDVRQVGHELSARYVLEGSVRKAGDRVRITGQLIDAQTGAHLWADRFDGSLEDVFELQDKIASSVAGVIEPALQAAETARSAARPTDDLTAYDLYLRAYAMVWSSARQIPEALRLMELAIARDPRYGPALAWAAYCCVRLLRDERSEDREADRLKGADFARRALEVAGDDPGILANAAQALAYLGEDIGAMMVLVDRAVVLNPSFARGWHISGTLRDWAGQPKIAIEHAETALRLSPRARVGPTLLVIGAAHFYSRRFDEAVPKLLVAIQEDPSFPAPYRILAACYSHMGRLDDARETVMRLRAITPVVIPDASYLRNAEHRELFLSGLRLASGEGNGVKPAPPRVDNPPDAAPIEPRQAERRNITALFCELIGAAAGGDGTGLEDLREAIGDFHRCVLEVAGRHQGFVYRDLGNSALVLFGYPEAHEHDAEQAVRTGLELCGAVRTPRPDAEALLRCRVGIATGMIIVGDLVGAGVARGESIVGNAPNLAARLALSTPPDTVAVELATRGLIGNLFDCRELGAVEAAGGTDPIRSWQVLGKSIVESRFEALRGPALTPLVGRDEEIDLLLRRWARAKTGDGQVVLVSGEPGIGKSRIAAALEERLGGEPHLRLRYFCSPHHQDSALFPFVEQLAHAAGFARDDTSAAKLEKLEILLALAAPPDEDVALLADVLSLPASEQHPLPSLGPQRKKDRTLEALIRQLEGLARRQPVVTVFEDAHWIDPTSRELLDLTVERLRTLPVLLIMTFRPEFQPPWSGLEQVSTLALNRLGRHDRAVLVEQTAGGKALPDEVVAQIAERTDGVPLFVEELTKGVLESGLLREEADRYVLDGALPELAIPMSLHASLLARLDRLAPARQVAQIGAAIGRQFSYALLCAVTRLPEDELQAALTRLVASELVSQRGTPPDAVYSFKHALVQDAAHGSLLRKTRQQLHALIAGVLEADSPDIMENQPELLARHYTEGGLVEKAVAYWGKAGRRSAANSAMAEAAAQFQKGLDQLALLPENPERQQQELEFFCGLGAVLQIVKGFAAPETGHAYARARELWARLDSPSEFLQVPYGQSVYHGFRGELDLAQRLDEDLLRLSSQRNDSAGLVLGHLSSGRNLMYGGRFVASRSHLEAGLALYDPISHRSLVHQVGYSPQVLSQAFLGIVLFCLGFPDQALARSGTAIAEARRLAHPPSLAVNLGQSARLLSLIGDNAALDERAGQLVAVATEQGFSHWLAEGTIFRGWIKVRNGDVAEGISVLRSGSAAYSATGAGVWMPYFLALLAGADEMSGQIQGALTLLDEALRTVELTGERFFAAELNRHKGRLLLRQGYSEVAEDFYRRALSIAEEQGAKLWELRAAVTLARLLRDQGCRGEARDLLAPVYGWFTEGFATPDLQEAKALIDELAAPPARISGGRKPRQSPRPACGETDAGNALRGESE